MAAQTGPGDQLSSTHPKQRTEKLEQSLLHRREMLLGAPYSGPKGQWASNVKKAVEVEYPLLRGNKWSSGVGRASRMEVSSLNPQPFTGTAQRKVQWAGGLGLHLAMVNDDGSQD